MVVKASDYLVELLGDFSREPRLVVVAGHPGSGKTTFAATICLYTMERNGRCLYISFQEDRDRLFKQLSSVGIDFSVFESKNLLRFVKIPVPASEDAAQLFVDGVSRIVADYGPRTVVVDSITPLFNCLRDDAKARAYLQNFFWELQKVVNGAVVLVSEIPLESESAELGWIEFVADAVLILRYRVVRGLVERMLEIRKVRGRELTVAEIPFSIKSGEGIILYPPIILSEVRSPRRRRVFTHYRDGSLIEVEKPAQIAYIEYPPELSLSLPLVATILTHVLSDGDGKILLIEYWFPEEQIREFIADALRLYGASKEVVEHILKRLVIRNINPTALSTAELVSRVVDYIENVNPVAVVFHDALLPTSMAIDTRYYINVIYNLLLHLKSMGIDVARLSSRTSIETDLNKVLADHIVSIRCVDSVCSDFVADVYIDGKRYRMSWTELENQTKKIIEHLNKGLQSK